MGPAMLWGRPEYAIVIDGTDINRLAVCNCVLFASGRYCKLCFNTLSKKKQFSSLIRTQTLLPRAQKPFLLQVLWNSN